MDTRRDFLKKSAAIASGVSIMGLSGTSLYGSSSKDSLFKISLAEWSLNKSIRNGEVDHLDFAKIAKKNFDIDAIEYVNQLFADKTGGSTYLKEMKNIADGEGVKSLLIMCDREGALGDPDDVARTTAVKNHYKWVDAAKYLGCHSIRVNAQSEGEYDEQMKLASDGLGRLTEYGAKHDINIIVENHGGLSSNGKWLSGVMDMVNHPRCGTLPDFGNFYLGTWEEKGKECIDASRGRMQSGVLFKGERRDNKTRIQARSAGNKEYSPKGRHGTITQGFKQAAMEIRSTLPGGDTGQ